MKSSAIELHSTVAPEVKPRLRIGARAAAYFELTKPRITGLIMLTAAAGFGLGSQGATNYLLLMHAMIGIGLLASGLGTLNEFMERDLDRLMRRTADRPLPTNRVQPFEALWFGLTLIIVAELYLALFTNSLTSILGLTVVAGYLFAYTPLKTRSTFSTFVGAQNHPELCRDKARSRQFSQGKPPENSNTKLTYRTGTFAFRCRCFSWSQS